MLLRAATMTFLVVSMLLTNLCHSQDTFSSTEENQEMGRRAYLKRRILERLARRGLSAYERNHVAEELLSRILASHPKYSTTPKHSAHLPVNPYMYATIPSPKIVSEESTTFRTYLWNSSEVPWYDDFDGGHIHARNDTSWRLQQEVNDQEWVEGAHMERLLQLERGKTPRAARDSATAIENHKKRDKINKKAERKKRREERKLKRKRERNKKIEKLIAQEADFLHEVDGEQFIDCCPSKSIVTHVKVGKNRIHQSVEVHPVQQLFYERVCLEEFDGKECVFPHKTLRKGVVTRCAQQYSYTQALVAPFLGELLFEDMERDWKIDYIRIRSGCSCQVSVSKRRKRRERDFL